ncbi:MAG: cation-translocating P-type ATPase [Gemmatimonadaceae bacterium]
MLNNDTRGPAGATARAATAETSRRSPSAELGRESAHGWYTLAPDQVVSALDTDEGQGLSAAEVKLRFMQHGPNELADIRRRHPLRILIGQFSDMMVLVLIAAAGIAAALGEPQDVAAIVAIISLNAVLGFSQEFRAERAMEALKALGAPSARVRRDGEEQTIPATGLVPGDIVRLEAGNVIPADLRLIEVARLGVDEASLTGESQVVSKSVHAIAHRDLPLADQLNMAYKGTVVASGRGVGVVIATGMRTELGRIASLLANEPAVSSPLQVRLARFGRYMAAAVVALCVVIFVTGLLRGEPATLMFMTALSLAVAAIPESLPAVVTVSLALGARKMARQQALIRRLSAVETLGSVTYICTDKTGTLTENRMSVQSVVPYGATARAPPTPHAPPSEGLVEEMFVAMALGTDAVERADGSLSGDPTEMALHRHAAFAGFAPARLAARFPRVGEVPFSSDRARMTTIHRDVSTGRFIAYVKGAPERVIARCRAVPGAGAPLDVEGQLARAEGMARTGMRVLAFADRELDELPNDYEDVEHSLRWLGLVGLLDPPRPEVLAAVRDCQTAGIRVVMITGDHPSTALAVARHLGIAAENDPILTGDSLARMSPETLERAVGEARVFARVVPEDKIRVVKALQCRGEFVAVTGDGVNDAPALRRADIGIAMGRAGTDVAREAAHMVLLDDNFATIVKAVREGRRIYDNIRRFVRYSLSTNAGEIWTLFVAPLLGLPLPLLPIHILWMNLVTDGLPGLALAAEPAGEDVIRRPPRSPRESIFAQGLWQHAVWVGLLMAGLALGTQAWSLYIGDSHWQSMTFTVLTLSQLAHVMAIRSEHQSLATLGLLSNRPLLYTVGMTIALQLSILYVTPLNRVFQTVPLTLGEFAICCALASVVLVAVEIEKVMIRRGWLRRQAST